MKRFLSAITIVLVTLCMCIMTACVPTPGIEPAPPTDEQPDTPVLSTKKGVSVSRYDDGSEKSAGLLEDLGISWYYNWGAEDFADNIDAEYVPMIWGAGSVNARTLNSISEGYTAGKYKHLLTFNEPDASTPGISSGVSVEKALELWPQLEALGIPLSSPAPTTYSTGWLDEFMSGAKSQGYRVDFIALHCYQNFADPNAVAELRQQLIEIYEKYQLPIWITEFATIDIWVWGGHPGNPDCTQDAALRYTKDVTDMLESLGFVERYAWFIDNTNSPDEARGTEAQYTFLYNNDDTISETGKVYKAQPSSKPLRICDIADTVKANESFFINLQAFGGTGELTFSNTVPVGVTFWNQLPDGVSISSTGILYGTLSQAGTYTICITVEDTNGQTTFRYLKLVVEE